jgi:hypothetical protein
MSSLFCSPYELMPVSTLPLDPHWLRTGCGSKIRHCPSVPLGIAQANRNHSSSGRLYNSRTTFRQRLLRWLKAIRVIASVASFCLLRAPRIPHAPVEERPILATRIIRISKFAIYAACCGSRRLSQPSSKEAEEAGPHLRLRMSFPDGLSKSGLFLLPCILSFLLPY